MSSNQNPAPSGWLLIHKPKGSSSFKEVQKVRKLLNIKKVGHAGTLDPLAEGLMLVAVGEATKTIQFAQGQDKTYEFCVTWGSQTTTDDAEGEVVAISDVRPSRQAIIEILPQFLGEIEQIPPKYSAIKMDGMPLYKKARAGEEFEVPKRIVTIASLTLLESDDERAFFRVKCSKGTYVRSLARDLAEQLGTKGYVTFLNRTKIGKFLLKNAISLDNYDNLVHNAPLISCMMPVHSVLDDIPVVALSQEDAVKVKQGQHIMVSDHKEEMPLMVAKQDDRLVALGTIVNCKFKPQKVFNLL